MEILESSDRQRPSTQRTSIDLDTISIVRSLRAGQSRNALHNKMGVSLSTIEKLESAYQSVPDGLLSSIERLLRDRERLRRLISDLMRTRG